MKIASEMSSNSSSLAWHASRQEGSSAPRKMKARVAIGSARFTTPSQSPRRKCAGWARLADPFGHQIRGGRVHHSGPEGRHAGNARRLHAGEKHRKLRLPGRNNAGIQAKSQIAGRVAVDHAGTFARRLPAEVEILQRMMAVGAVGRKIGSGTTLEVGAGVPGFGHPR